MNRNWRRIEQTIIIEIISRVALVAALIVNAVQGAHLLSQWYDGITAALLAGAIEAALFIATHMISERLVYNATKLKSAPAKAIGTLVIPLVFFGALSAFANVSYLSTKGAGWSNGLAFGAAAPFVVGFIAWMFANHAATERRVSEFEADRKQKAAKARETKAERKREEAAEKQQAADLPFVCEICSENGEERRFATTNARNAHMRVHRADRQWPRASNDGGAE